MQPNESNGNVKAGRRYYTPFKAFIGAVIPNWLMKRTDISQGAKLCFGRLAQYAGRNHGAFPGRETLAVELGVSGATVRDYLAALVKADLIECQRIGCTKENIYWFIVNPDLEFRSSDLQKSVDHSQRKTGKSDLQKSVSLDLQKSVDPSNKKRIIEEDHEEMPAALSLSEHFKRNQIRCRTRPPWPPATRGGKQKKHEWKNIS
jgi:hypothetical protein